MKAGIIGLGLMGGSLGLALKEIRYFDKVVGYIRNTKHKDDIFRLALVDELVEFDEITKCDVIFLAVPVDTIMAILQELDGKIKEDCTIIDMGSTKEKISKDSPISIRKNLVPAHPMTGTEFSGPTASKYGLYKDKIVVLCDLEESGKKQSDIAIDIFKKIGMNIIYMHSHEHDRHAAFISHLPHALSYSLANSVLSQEDPQSILAMAAGGFRDMSRLAKSSPDMWCDIFRQNKNFVLEAMERYERDFMTIKKFIEDENWDGIYTFMEKANILHKIIKN